MPGKLKFPATALCAFFLTTSITLAAPIVIDAFITPQTVFIPSSASGNVFVANSTSANAPNALGGQRELVIRRDSLTQGGSVNKGSADLTVFADDGILSFNNGRFSSAWALVTWDGPGISTADATSFNPAMGHYGTPDTYGLSGTGTTGGVNLTAGGRSKILLTAGSDLGMTIWLTFYNSANVYARGQIAVSPGTIGAEADYLLPFSSFTLTGASSSAAVFSDVKAITMLLNGPVAADADVSRFMIPDGPPMDPAQSPVPEPAALLLTGAGLFGVAVGSRRFRRQA